MSVSLDEICMMFKAENASMLDGALQNMEEADGGKAGWPRGSFHEGDLGSSESDGTAGSSELETETMETTNLLFRR